MECERTAACCIVLLADTAEDALLILDPPLSAVEVTDCSDIGVDTDDVDELVTADDEFVASVIVN